MSLKISFESDLKGFERVQSALKEQEKILNSNADAVERLKKAQAGMAGEAVDMGKNHSMKAAAKQMETLTNAFDTLQKSQSGFRAFLNNFGEFKKELQDISNIKSNDVFGAIETRIDTLKKSLSGSVIAAKDLKAEVAQLKAEGRSEEAAKTQEKLRKVEDQALQERSLLQDAQLKKLYRQPLLQFGGQGGMPPGGGGGMGGFLGGGTSIQRMMGIFGKTTAAITTALAAGRQFASIHDGFAFRGQRGEIALFDQEMSIQRQAESGNIGRDLLRRRGLGHEGNLLRRQAEGELGGESILDNISIFAKHAYKGLIQRKGSGEIQAELAAERSALDKKSQDSINMIASAAKGMITSNPFMAYESVLGRQGAQGLVQAVNRGGASFAEAQATLQAADRYGLAGAFAGSRLTRTTGELGLSRQAIDQMIRQSAYTGVDQDDLMGRMMTRAGQSGMPLTTTNRQMLSQIIAQQAGQFAGGVDMGEVAAPLLNTMANMGGMQLFGADRVTGAQEIAGFAQGRAQQAGTMEGMGLEKALIDLGITNPVARRGIIELYTNRQAQKAIRVAAKLSGKSPEEVQKALDGSQSMAKEFRKQIVGGADMDTLQAAFGGEGVDLLGFAASGSMKSAMAVAGGYEAYERLDLGAQADLDVGPSLTETTAGRKVKASEARRESESLKMADQLASSLSTQGGDAGKKLVELFTGYTDQMLMQVQEGIADVLSRQREIDLEDDRIPTVKPFDGPKKEAK